MSREPSREADRVLPLEAIFPVLDVILAAVFAAWILGLATAESAEVATRRMLGRAERVRLGALAFASGTFVHIASLVAHLVGMEALSSLVAFFAYPIWITGAISLASATWGTRERPLPAAGTSA